MFGGVTTDRRASTTCDARDNPERRSRFCDSVPPFRTTVKASAAYTFPYDVKVSGSFSSIPGPSVGANYTVTSAIAGRHDHRIDGRRGVDRDVNLIEPGTVFLDTQNRLDLRLGKTFRSDRTKIQGFVDLFNVLNAGTVLTVNQTYAAAGTNAWMTPNTIIGRPLRAVRPADVVLAVLLTASGRGEDTAPRRGPSFAVRSNQKDSVFV